MDKDIKKSISATDKDAQYDEKAKNLLGHKIILAHILVKTIDEFKGMNPKDVVQYIEGEPYISTVSVDAGSTNVEKEQDGEKVVNFLREYATRDAENKFFEKWLNFNTYRKVTVK